MMRSISEARLWVLGNLSDGYAVGGISDQSFVAVPRQNYRDNPWTLTVAERDGALIILCSMCGCFVSVDCDTDEKFEHQMRIALMP